MMSNINRNFLDKETTHNLTVEMWNSIAENAEEIKSKDLYDIKRDIFNKLVTKYNLTYINNLRIQHQNCFACIFYNKYFEKDCKKCPFSIYNGLLKNYSGSKEMATYCEEGISSPYRKIRCINGLRFYCGTPRTLSDWHIECFKKHCIEICDLFIE